MTATPLILLVDDDPAMLRLYGEWLQAHGFRTQSASDPIQAGVMLRRELPDLMVLDLGMPGGGGLRVLDRLRVQNKLDDLPVLVVTADTSPEAAREVAARQVTRLLHKPMPPETLVAQIRELLAEGRGTGG